MGLLYIGLILVCLSFLVKKNKLFYCLQFAYLWFIATFNTQNADYFHYMNGYNHMFDYHGFISEPLYWLLVRTSGLLGLDFQTYRAFFFGSALLILAYAIWKLSKKPNIAFALYFIYPLTMDVIQMRSMMASALIMLSIVHYLDYLQDTTKSKKLVSSIVMIILATGMHYSAALAAIIYLSLINRHWLRKHLFGAAMFVIIILGTMIAFRGRIMALLASTGVIEKSGGYISRGTNLGGYIATVFVLRWALVLMSWLMLHLPKESSGTETLKYEHSMFMLIFLLALMSFVEILFSMEFERIARLGVVLWYSYITRSYSHLERRNAQAYRALCIAYIGVFFYVMMFLHYSDRQWIYHAFYPIFENNLFI